MSLRPGLVATALVAVATPALAAPDAAVARAAAYNDAVLGVMKAGLAQPARVERFRGLVPQYYDMNAIAALVAGPAWTGASAADRQALVAALVRHSAISLARNFDRFSGERFVVDPASQARGDSSLVKATIVSSGGKQDILYYRMRAGRIVDVISGGVSQLAVQRSDVAAAASAGGIPAIVRRFAQVDGKAG